MKVLVKQISFRKTRNGPLRIYELPEPEISYVVGADPAGGLSDSDPSTASVRRKDTCEQVCVYSGLSEPEVFARDLDLLGRWYNRALLGVESNNHGEAVLNALKNTYHYPAIFTRERFDKVYKVVTEQMGWRTTSQSKEHLVATAQKYIMFEDIDMKDKDCILQFMRYISIDGKYGSGKGKKFSGEDDLVISDMLAVMMLDLHPQADLKNFQYDTYTITDTSSRM